MCRAIVCVAVALLPAVAGAATYTCVDADGRTAFSDRPCPADAAAAARRDAGTHGYLAPRHGLTFGLLLLPDGSVDARCEAAPVPADRPREGGCDGERGDTACSRALPVLCFKPGAQRTRAPAVVDAATGRITWPATPGGPQLGASPALRGERLVSQQSGTQACAQALGSGWRMASAADSAAWAPQALRHASLAASTGRLWVASDGAGGNCWSAPPAPATAASAPAPDEKQLVADLLKVRSSPEYARLPPACRQRYDEIERGLRQHPDGAGPSEASLAPLLAWLQECAAAPTAPR